jgi:hypothetical protein
VKCACKRPSRVTSDGRLHNNKVYNGMVRTAHPIRQRPLGTRCSDRAAALKLLDAWHAVHHIGTSDALIYLALGDPEISIGPELRQLSDEARRWIRRHRGYRRDDAPIVAKLARRAE